jgi:hypothetical protein
MNYLQLAIVSLLTGKLIMHYASLIISAEKYLG